MTRSMTLFLWTSVVGAALLLAAVITFHAPPPADSTPNIAQTTSKSDREPMAATTGSDPQAATSALPHVAELTEPAVTAPHKILRRPDDPPEDAIWPAEPLPDSAAKPRAGSALSTATSTECVAKELRDVLADLEGKFSGLTIVATTELRTNNHSPGSIREKLHHACQAVDITTPHPAPEVVAYLRSRPEVGGINSYRNGVIHFDLNAGYAAKIAGAKTAPQRSGPQRSGGVAGSKPGPTLPSIFNAPGPDDPAVRAYRDSR